MDKAAEVRTVNPFKFWLSFFLEGTRGGLIHFTSSICQVEACTTKKKVHELLRTFLLFITLNIGHQLPS